MSVDPKLPPLDSNGHLQNSMDWSEGVANELAARDSIVLQAEHWELIYFVRDYHADYETAPGMRLLVSAVKQRLEPAKASSRYLYRLFPDSPARQLACYAGFPKPISCI